MTSVTPMAAASLMLPVTMSEMIVVSTVPVMPEESALAKLQFPRWAQSIRPSAASR